MQFYVAKDLNCYLNTIIAGSCGGYELIFAADLPRKIVSLQCHIDAAEVERNGFRAMIVRSQIGN